MRYVFVATSNRREAKAVHEVVDSFKKSGDPDRTFNGRDTEVPRYSYVITTRNGPIQIDVGQANETGGDEAADLVRRIDGELRPDAVFFVGCAGYLDEKGAAERGTVFVFKSARDGDTVQINPGGKLYDLEQRHGSGRLISKFVNFAVGGGFDPIRVVTNREAVSTAAFHADKDSADRRDLLTKFPSDAVLIEMEAYLAYKEAERLRDRGRGFPLLMIKGISDYGDAGALESKAITQELATRNAATVLMRLLNEVAG